MQSQITVPVTYYLQEGKANLRQTIEIAVTAARAHRINKLVIFTSQGDGVRIALDILAQPTSEAETSKIGLVGVTFPQGTQFVDEKNEPFAVEISPENQQLFAKAAIPLIRAHLPFSPIPPYFKDRGVLANDLSLIENALNIFGGSMSLCVQAVLMACDAGALEIGEHVIACTADTAVLARATCTTRLLRDFIIREILCKPAVFDIGKKEKHTAGLPGEEPQQLTSEIKVLGEGPK